MVLDTWEKEFLKLGGSKRQCHGYEILKEVRRAPASREVFLRPALPEPEPTPGSILLLSKILAGLSGKKLGISMIRYGVLLFVFNNGIKEIQMTLI